MSDLARALRSACHGREPGRDGWPSVSVVVPVKDEAPYLQQAVASILAQDYPIEFDVCLAVAPSDDDTAAVAERLATDNLRVTTVSNPAGNTPAGLNAAIGATRGSIVVRVDGHAALSPGYMRHAVATMCRTGAVNVGGLQVPAAETTFEAAVAAATTSWLGTGGATYRVGGDEGPVDTVYLGVFDRSAGDAVGWYDESLIRNQDYELNIRLRGAGGVVWFDPQLSAAYRPRGSFSALARQYFEYGRWKAEVVRRHPGSLRPRQVIAAVVPVGLVVSTACSFRRRRFLLLPAVYLAAIGLAGRRSLTASAPYIPAVLATQHFSWSAGFVAGGCPPTGSGGSPVHRNAPQ